MTISEDLLKEYPDMSINTALELERDELIYGNCYFKITRNTDETRTFKRLDPVKVLYTIKMFRNLSE